MYQKWTWNISTGTEGHSSYRSTYTSIEVLRCHNSVCRTPIIGYSMVHNGLLMSKPKHLTCKPYQLPRIFYNIYHLKWLKFDTNLYIIIVYYTIELFSHSKYMITIVAGFLIQGLMFLFEINVYLWHTKLVYTDTMRKFYKFMSQRIILNSFGPNIEHISGADSIVVDMLSRMKLWQTTKMRLEVIRVCILQMKTNLMWWIRLMKLVTPSGYFISVERDKTELIYGKSKIRV